MTNTTQNMQGKSSNKPKKCTSMTKFMDVQLVKDGSQMLEIQRTGKAQRPSSSIVRCFLQQWDKQGTNTSRERKLRELMLQNQSPKRPKPSRTPISRPSTLKFQTFHPKEAPCTSSKEAACHPPIRDSSQLINRTSYITRQPTIRNSRSPWSSRRLPPSCRRSLNSLP